jgi:rubredoxin-NAD+ reductase
MSDQEDWRQYVCRACGLIYDERLGDPDSGLKPGTRFEDIPDDWQCPVCGVTKADFEPYERSPVATSSANVASSHRTGVVIVGGGIAGWSVAGALRSADENVPITIVTACSGDFYHKPELSVALSRGLSPEGIGVEPGQRIAKRLGVNLLSDTFVIGISPQQHHIRTTRGTLRYSNLVLAQGAKPTLPPTLPPSLCWHINDFTAWSGLYRRLSGGPKRIVIVGAGMVGCELAEDLARAHHDVTLIDLKLTPLGDMLPQLAAERLQNGLESVGVRFIGNITVREVSEDTHCKRIYAKCGQVFDADLIVAATGLAVDGRLAKAAGIAFDRGIVVDAQTLRTSADEVYAIGDCISIDGLSCRFIEPIPHHAKILANQILERRSEADLYRPSTVTIRLKTRSAQIVLRGMPLKEGRWHVVQESHAELVMEQWFSGIRQSEVTVRQSPRLS